MKNEIKLNLIEQGEFLGIDCDFYKDDKNNIYMTKEQIGRALQYSNSQKAMDNIHSRNKDRLDKFSVTLKLRGTDGKSYDTRVYIEKGIYEICRYSRQEVADDFYDWVYDTIIQLRQTSGVVSVGEEKEFLDNYFPTLSEDTKLAMVKDLHENAKLQQQKIQEMQPKVDDWEAFMDVGNHITMNSASKALNIKGLGRNNLFKLLRDKGILMEGNEPYQRFVKSGYFKVIMTVKNGFSTPQTVVSAKGMSYINKKVKEWGYI